jgi:uridylate kinase
MKYKRIMLKLSGEGLSGANSNLAIDPQVVHKIAVQVHQLIKDGIEVAIVVGGGNF